LLFKLGLPFGILTRAALIWAAARTVQNRSYLLIMLVLVLYGLLIVFLPLRQPFWLMSVYPLLLLTLSGAIVEAYRRAGNVKLRWAWLAYIVFAAGWLAIGLTQVYPTYGYYGYELVGDQWLGMESRGHRSLVVVTNDGSTSAIDWLRQNVPADALVVSYLEDPHFVDYLESIEPFVFELKQALRYKEKTSLLQDLKQAEFVVVRPFRDVEFVVAWDDPLLVDCFGTEPVFSVLRGRGVYEMPVVLIYQRLHD